MSKRVPSFRMLYLMKSSMLVAVHASHEDLAPLRACVARSFEVTAKRLSFSQCRFHSPLWLLCRSWGRSMALSCKTRVLQVLSRPVAAILSRRYQLVITNAIDSCCVSCAGERFCSSSDVTIFHVSQCFDGLGAFSDGAICL